MGTAGVPRGKQSVFVLQPSGDIHIDVDLIDTHLHSMRFAVQQRAGASFGTPLRQVGKTVTWKCQRWAVGIVAGGGENLLRMSLMCTEKASDMDVVRG